MNTLVRDCEAVWKNCLDIIQKNTNEKSFQTWFSPIVPIHLDDDVLTIQVPSQFFYEWLEEHFVQILKLAISSELGPTGRLEYSIIVDKGNDKSGSLSMNIPTSKVSTYRQTQHGQRFVQAPELRAYTEKQIFRSTLNPNYSFENFIEGDCNRLARSAGQAVANQPGTTSFNPLVIYGAMGLGKTHLAQAIGNKIKKEYPDKNVLYISSEKFVNHFMESVRTNSLPDCQEFYQNVDVLIVDDIQFFTSKEKTQEMFFNIFNHLHQSKKQIIMTSNCAVRELKGMDERLLSRFKWGLNADMQSPDFETRVAIIEQKLESEGIEVPMDVVEFLAHIEIDIRELEGILVQLIAQSSLNRKEIDLDLAKMIVHTQVQVISTEVTVDFIQKAVSEFFGITIEEMKSKSRKKELVIPRQIGIYFSKNYTSLSLKTIGLYFGGRDHSTVIHSIETVEDMMVTDKKFKAQVLELQKKMKLKVL